jgi:hypothetical protein
VYVHADALFSIKFNLTVHAVKQVFASYELIGWYAVAAVPTPQHLILHKQVRLLVLVALKEHT